MIIVAAIGDGRVALLIGGHREGVIIASSYMYWEWPLEAALSSWMVIGDAGVVYS